MTRLWTNKFLFMRSRRSWTFEYQRKRVIRFCVGHSLVFSLVSLSFYSLPRCVFSLDTLVRDEWSYIYPTRLETRTKESSMCASHWILRNLKAKWKWKLPFGCLGVIKLLFAQHRPVTLVLLYGCERAYMLGPERWWTMPEQDEVRGNSDGGP